MSIKIVTDSLADIPPEVAHEEGIAVVPLNIHFGTDTYRDGIDITGDEFYKRLPTANPLPTTSQPSPSAFADVFREALDAGDSVLCINASSKLSGTHNSAVLGRDEALTAWKEAHPRDEPPEIVVFDTTWVSMAEGMEPLAAARAARDGASMASLVAMIQSMKERTNCAILFDTLEFLAKGGRVGKAQSFLGSLLNVKPILQLMDGEVHPRERVRTTAKARRRLRDIVVESAPLEQVYVAYTTTPDIAGEIAQELKQYVPSGEVGVVQIGPVIGVYAGPGLIATLWRRAEA